jgi:hypothetical protein
MATLAFGSGGLWGLGLGNSRLKLGLLLDGETAADQKLPFQKQVFGEEGSDSSGSQEHGHAKEQVHEQDDGLFHGQAA